MNLIQKWRGALIALFLALSLLVTERRAEPYGDTLQVVLPLAAWGCSALNGEALEYFGRYAAMWISVRATKAALPDEYDARPHGGRDGFPSAHTSSAAFGASSLVFSCLEGSIMKTGVVFAAAFTGASRMEVRAHDIWQVMAGAIWGLLFERIMRRPSPLRRRAARLVNRRGGGL